MRTRWANILFESHREFLKGRQVEYGWAEAVGLELMQEEVGLAIEAAAGAGSR